MEKIDTGIYRKPSGLLHVHTTAKDPYTGNIRHKRKTLKEGATLEDAKAVRHALKSAVLNRRKTNRPNASNVEQYATRWLERKQRPPRPLKPTTVDAYAYALDAFCSFAGAVELSTITRIDVMGYRDWLQKLRKDDGTLYSTSSLGVWWRPVVTMLRDAVADDLIDRDPTFRVESPVTSVTAVKEVQTLSRSELASIVDAARKVCANRSAEIVTLCYTGMRSGELWGLQWQDIDWAGPRIHIRRSVSLGEIIEGTKTGTGRETYMPDVVGFALAEWFEQSKDTRPEALVFPSRAGTPRRRSSLTKPLAAVRIEAGIQQRVTAQVLRRSYNTLLRGLGVDWIVLQSMMGHSSDEMTQRYSGVRLDEKRGAVLRLVRG